MKIDSKIKKGALWNAVGSGIFATTNLVFLTIVKRISGLDAAGAFSLAFATAQILYIVGIYGMNAYQMTDYKGEYKFEYYVSAKIFSTILMMLGCCIYMAAKREPQENVLTFLLTIYFAVCSFAEVFQSQLFVKQRLDLSGQSLFFRTLFSLVGFGSCMIVTKNVYVSIVLAILINLFATYFFSVRFLLKYEKFMVSKDYCRIKELIKVNTPLFLCSFFFTFLNNMGKYSIDYYWDNHVQGIYSIIFIPVMAMILLCDFIYKPVLPNILSAIEKRNKRLVHAVIWKGFGIIIIFIFFGIGGMHLLGIRVMEWIFSIDLSSYHSDLYLMIIGAATVAIVNFYYYIMIALRKEAAVFKGCMIGVLIGCIMAVLLVRQYPIKGGLLSFIIGYGIIALYYICVMTDYIKKWE